MNNERENRIEDTILLAVYSKINIKQRRKRKLPFSTLRGELLERERERERQKQRETANLNPLCHYKLQMINIANHIYTKLFKEIRD